MPSQEQMSEGARETETGREKLKRTDLMEARTSCSGSGTGRGNGAAQLTPTQMMSLNTIEREGHLSERERKMDTDRMRALFHLTQPLTKNMEECLETLAKASPAEQPLARQPLLTRSVPKGAS
jgi:hypothetical protein